MNSLFKHIILAFCFSIVLNSPTIVFSQTTASATLNVVLADVRSIKVNPAQNVVNITFSNSSDYSNGVAINQIGHLEITSTSGYIVKARASSANLIFGAEQIPVSTVTLTASLNSGGISSSSSTGKANTSTYVYPIRLSTTPRVMIEGSLGGAGIIYDVNYKAGGGVDYMNKPSGNYSTTIIYTIEPN